MGGSVQEGDLSIVAILIGIRVAVIGAVLVAEIHVVGKLRAVVGDLNIGLERRTAVDRLRGEDLRLSVQDRIVAGVVPGDRDVSRGLIHIDPGKKLRRDAGRAIVVDLQRSAPGSSAICRTDEIGVGVRERRTRRREIAVNEVDIALVRRSPVDGDRGESRLCVAIEAGWVHVDPPSLDDAKTVVSPLWAPA
mgnify:CR=1 FL=1